MINTIWGSTDKPVSSKLLSESLSTEHEIDGTLYIGYPVIGTPEGSYPIDALLVSPSKGLIIFSLVEGRTLPDYKQIQDDGYNKVTAKLLQHHSLIKKRELQVKPKAVTFAPAVSALPTDVNYPICNAESLATTLNDFDDFDQSYFTSLASVIQAISTLRRGRKKRDLHNKESRGSKVKRLEESIANLDSRQSAAVVETHDGIQRIRGLAGCGKTIVLALKIAYLHARHPDWNIAVTFNTRSLKKQFENLITTFVLEQANEEPDWDKIRIINAWGAPGGRERTGIYYEFCIDHGIEYFDFGRAKDKFSTDSAFEAICDLALKQVKSITPKYDVILVDEAQDFSPNFLLLCYEYLKAPKRLVYAYDELQKLGSRSLPPAEEIFGNNPDGTPRVVIQHQEPGKPRQDIILDTCYRNSRPVLTTAHALGFGIYRKKGLVQIFENNNLWQDIGYDSKDGEIADGLNVSLSRNSNSSPEFLEFHSDINDLILFREFCTLDQQTEWLVSEIKRNLSADELLPDDIVVINPNPLTTGEAVGPARAALFADGINSNLAGVSTIADVFTEPGTITFSGIFRAKGNEAPMVYIINAQDCFDSHSPREVALIRNRLFTAITRSKAWVRILGVGKGMTELIEEFEAIKRNNFALNFKYPTEAERKTMLTVNRDMSNSEKERRSKFKINLREIVDSRTSGETNLQDYPEDLIAILKRSLVRAEASQKKTRRK